MHVLVIGGTRYMGRIAVQSLLDRGDEVTVYSRGNSRPEWWDRVAHVAGDRTDTEAFQAALKGRTFDAVLDMHWMEAPSRMLVTAGRDGVVKVWR